MPLPPEMTQAFSSNVREFGYDTELLELWVLYRNTPGHYVYEGVPVEVFRGLLAAPSKGRFLHEQVLSRYDERHTRP